MWKKQFIAIFKNVRKWPAAEPGCLFKKYVCPNQSLFSTDDQLLIWVINNTKQPLILSQRLVKSSYLVISYVINLSWHGRQQIFREGYWIFFSAVTWNISNNYNECFLELSDYFRFGILFRCFGILSTTSFNSSLEVFLKIVEMAFWNF